jgi:hypothetical protein
MMRKYLVEVRRVSYISAEIDATSREDAQAQMWEQVEARGDIGYADWELSLCEELPEDQE